MKKTARYLHIFGIILCLGCSTGSESQEELSPAEDVQVSDDEGAAQPDASEDGADAQAPQADVPAQPEDAAVEDIAQDPGNAPQGPWSDAADFIEEQMAMAHIPGLAVAVTRPGEVLWTGAFGLANRETNLEVTADTPFMLASVSKTVTAAAVMHAWQEGDFDLDDDINTLLPFIVDNPRVEGEEISVRHLVSHTSGIKDNWGQMPYADGDSPHSLGAYLEGYLVQGGSWFHATKNFYENMPGTAREYGNIATALAGFVVEATTDTPFDEYSKAYIFDVLSMENTGWHLADFDPATVAMPYEYVNGQYEALGHYGYADYPDGQLRCSVADLARFLAAISNQGQLGEVQILKPETVAEMLSPQFSSVDKGQLVFWYESTVAGRAVIAHNGGDKGVATQMVFSPETGIGVIVLTNTDWENLGGTYDAIADFLFDTAEELKQVR